MKGRGKKTFGGGACPYCEAWFVRRRDLEAHWKKSLSVKQRGEQEICYGIVEASKHGMNLAKYLLAVRRARFRTSRAAHVGVCAASSGTSVVFTEDMGYHDHSSVVGDQRGEHAHGAPAESVSSSDNATRPGEPPGAIMPSEDDESIDDVPEDDTGYHSYESWAGQEEETLLLPSESQGEAERGHRAEGKDDSVFHLVD